MSGTCFECKFMRSRPDLEPCEHCTNVFAMTGTHTSFEPRKTFTHADRIRAMSDEELAHFMMQTTDCPCVARANGCCRSDISCQKAWLDWLKQEAK